MDGVCSTVHAGLHLLDPRWSCTGGRVVTVVSEPSSRMEHLLKSMCILVCVNMAVGKSMLHNLRQ